MYWCPTKREITWEPPNHLRTTQSPHFLPAAPPAHLVLRCRMVMTASPLVTKMCGTAGKRDEAHLALSMRGISHQYNKANIYIMIHRHWFSRLLQGMERQRSSLYTCPVQLAPLRVFDTDWPILLTCGTCFACKHAELSLQKWLLLWRRGFLLHAPWNCYFHWTKASKNTSKNLAFTTKYKHINII